MPKEEQTIMGAALEKFFSEAEAGEEGLESLSKVEKPDDSKKEEVKKEEEQQTPPDNTQKQGEDDDEESEIDKINVDQIKTRAGIPISDNAKQQFKKLETSRNKWKTKAEEHANKLAELQKKLDEVSTTPQTPIEESEQFKAIKGELDKLKTEQDLLFFEKSDDWKNTFERPLAAVTERINGIISGVAKTISGQDKSTLGNLLTRANALLGNPESEAEYDAIVDLITSTVLTGTSGGKLARAMQDAWVLTSERENARKDRLSAREKITTEKAKTQASSLKSLEELLALQRTAFEQTPVGKHLSTALNDKVGYKQTVEQTSKEAMAVMELFLKTGTVTPELSAIIHNATLVKVAENERNYLLSGWKAMNELNEAQQKEINELKARIAELRGGVGENPTKDKSSTGDEKKKKGPFSIVDKLDQALKEVS